MHKLVYQCFKTLMVAILGIFIADMAFYLYRANTLNQKIENIASSLQKVVMENNYLPVAEKEMYEALFVQLGEQMEGSAGVNADPNLNFIRGFGWNYGRDADISVSGTGVNVVKDLSKVGEYGDIMAIQIEVGVNTPTWSVQTANYSDVMVREKRGDGTGTLSIEPNHVLFTYSYLVPCLKYSPITES